jgi:hypothetical protein
MKWVGGLMCVTRTGILSSSLSPPIASNEVWLTSRRARPLNSGVRRRGVHGRSFAAWMQGGRQAGSLKRPSCCGPEPWPFALGGLPRSIQVLASSAVSAMLVGRPQEPPQRGLINDSPAVFSLTGACPSGLLSGAGRSTGLDRQGPAGPPPGLLELQTMGTSLKFRPRLEALEDRLAPGGGWICKETTSAKTPRRLCASAMVPACG